MKRIFLGGTCNNSTWRDEMIPQLDPSKLSWFNPVVENWTEADMKKEIEERNVCDICLYFITPKMKGVYSIAEAVDDSNKRPLKTIFAYTGFDKTNSFDMSQMTSLKQVGKMVINNGGQAFESLDEVIKYLNTL
jgi:hypothetical protein